MGLVGGSGQDSLGIDTGMLLCTGGKQAMAYGIWIWGTSNSVLRDHRRIAAAIAALAGGTGGHNLDAALLSVDGCPSGRADLVFDGYRLPIGEWATAVF